ncbi:TrkA family potassium uptake protein [bacterium]|nr:TrkA family potassium uptake protein [bacterium]
MQFIIIGLGTFGTTVAETLYGEGQQVLVLDVNREKIENIKKKVTQAMQIDVTDYEKLGELGLEGIDCALVNLGEPMEASMLATMFLKEIGVKDIIVKAISDEHGKLLRMLGATQILFPEKDMAIRLGKSLASPGIVDHISLSPDYCIVEVQSPEAFWHKTLGELNIRRVHGVDVIALKRRNNGEDRMIMIPSANDIIEESDNLLLLGETLKIEQLKKL